MQISPCHFAISPFRTTLSHLPHITFLRPRQGGAVRTHSAVYLNSLSTTSHLLPHRMPPDATCSTFICLPSLAICWPSLLPQHSPLSAALPTSPPPVLSGHSFHQMLYVSAMSPPAYPLNHPIIPPQWLRSGRADQMPLPPQLPK